MSNDGTLVRGKLFSFESPRGIGKKILLCKKRKSIICSKDRHFPVRCKDVSLIRVF